MGDFTLNNHKSMAVLNNGETIFHRQLRILSEVGLKDFIITTGPFPEQLLEVTNLPQFKALNFSFVENPLYDKTNYIYSMYLAKDLIDDDVLLLHGDLVFNKKLIIDLLDHPAKSLATVNQSLPLPDKDFKCRIIDNLIKEVAIDIFDSDCVAFQPLYKLTKADVLLWLEKISQFIKEGNDQVYAENALNQITDQITINPFSYQNYFIDEVDNLDDLARVSSAIREFDFAEQEVYLENDLERVIKDILNKNNYHKVFVVSSNSSKSRIIEILSNKLNVNYVIFTAFSPNPKYSEVEEGVEQFKNENCDFILSIGGGSAIDVAKAIKLFVMLDSKRVYLKQDYLYSPYKHLTIPTTAGTGSEATRYSVIYYQGEKQSIHHDSIVPEYTILSPELLITLPLFQKKVTLLDAFCQAIESYWSVNSTSQSKALAKEAIILILDNYQSYLREDFTSYQDILLASNLSGEAINITQTTAPHALSYKLTSLYGIPHGQAVALSLPYIWREISISYQKTIDERGSKYLLETLNELAKIFEVNSIEESITKFETIYQSFNLAGPTLVNDDELDELVNSVNLQRLSNNPVSLDKEIIREIYINILNSKL